MDGGRELQIISQERPLDASLWQRAIDGINRLARNAGVGVLGELPAPPPVDSISVKGNLVNNVLTAPGELLHFTVTHNAPIQRGIRYLAEVDTDPSFPSPHQIDLGSSRSGFRSLPTKDDNNDPVAYYLRVTPQMPGSAPQKPTIYGGLQGPTQIVMSGNTSMSLLPSQAAGTAKPGQGGQGLGKVQSRGPVGGPKRSMPSVF